MLKPNFVGIVGGIIAFISIALPWWTMTQTSNLFGTTISMSVNLYLYRVNATLFDFEVGAKLWFGWTAFALMLACGILGIIGSIRRNSDILFAAAASAMSSIAIFTVGLLKELPEMPFMQESPKALFYFGTYGNSPFSFSIYLSFGFWLALTACIIMVITSARAIPLRTTMPRPPGPQLPLKYYR